MKKLIIFLSVSGVLFMFMHEFDAFFRGEWGMFRFLKRFREETKYLIFLYAHIPLTLFLFYYLWMVFSFNNFILWLIVNLFWVGHFAIHIIAKKWKSNVFHSIHSLLFISGAAITGIINLCLAPYYSN